MFKKTLIAAAVATLASSVAMADVSVRLKREIVEILSVLPHRCVQQIMQLP
jgi:hypothetical protein